ncbi:hypothetical protein VTO73DRAFT_13795 [Trametes versicolor]
MLRPRHRPPGPIEFGSAGDACRAPMVIERTFSSAVARHSRSLSLPAWLVFVNRSEPFAWWWDKMTQGVQRLLPLPRSYWDQIS